MPLDIVAVQLVARLTFTAVGAFQKNSQERTILKSIGEVRAELEKIERKTDHLILRDLLAAFKVLNGIAAEGTSESKATRLRFAEERLLASTSIESGQVLEGKEGTYWLVAAHYGLAYLAHIRGDEPTTAIHILEAFSLDPRRARREIFPYFFEEVFQAELAANVSWQEVERAKLRAEVDAFREKSKSPAMGYRDAAKALLPVIGFVAFALPVVVIPVVVVGIPAMLKNPKAREALQILIHSRFGSPEDRTRVFESMKEAELLERSEEDLDLRIAKAAISLRTELARN